MFIEIVAMNEYADLTRTSTFETFSEQLKTFPGTSLELHVNDW